MTTQPFKVGDTYLTKAGDPIDIINESGANGSYWTVQGSDKIWRYNRESDRGRVTASAFDMSDPRNLIPREAP